MSRLLAVGDIHGAYKALLQVLERANFAPTTDRLIFLGDVADGWPEVPEVFEFILGLDNYGYIMGNHDKWAYEYLKFGHMPHLWLSQGGRATMEAYVRFNDRKMEERHAKFLSDLPYYIEEGGNLFVHGGIDWSRPVGDQLGERMMWDRHMIQTAIYWEALKTGEKIKAYDEVFVGHTTTSRVDGSLKPLHVSNVWDLDQGAGWEGKLTCLDVETKEYWQSDIVSDLYPDVKGRGQN